MIGKTLSHYEILGQLGKGGMGEVFLAKDTRLERKVALKILPEAVAGDPGRRGRFEREAKAIGALNHPHIVTIYSIEQSQGLHFITMELVEGQTLRQMAKAQKIELETLLDLMIQVTDALSKAHRNGIVHRDLKPDNIMVNEDGLAKVLDFGLAKLLEQTTPASPTSEAPTEELTETGVGTVLGTPHYMSPEQARGEAVDHRSDIFSLCAVMYEMAGGRRPFEGDSKVEVLGAILKQEPRPISEINDSLPPQLQRIIHHGLSKRRDDRYHDIRDVWVDLREVRRELEPASGTRVSDLPRRPPRRSRSLPRALIVAAGMVGVAALFAGGYALYRGLRPPPPAVKPSVAVVWFKNLGGVEEQADYFAAGMTEDLVTELWKIGGLRVNTLDDIWRFKDGSLAAKEVGQRLGFRYVLTGTVQKAPERIRVTPRLVDVADGSLVWTARYDETPKNVFSVQDAIALQIADELSVALKSEEREQLRAVPTESQQAHDHYLRGRHHYYRTTVRDNELAVKEFQKALQFDPRYPLALAGLADAYVQRYKERYDYDEHWLDEAKKLVDRALEIDVDLAEAYESRAEAFLEEERLAEALEAAEKARSLRPEWDEPYVRLGRILAWRGEHGKALETYEKALAIRPSVAALCGKANILWQRGALEEARETYEAAVELNPDHDQPYRDLAGLHDELGQSERSEEYALRAIEVRPDQIGTYRERALRLYLTGRSDEAEEMLNSLKDRYPYNWEAYQTLAGYYEWWKGDSAAALAVVEESVVRNPDRAWPHLLLALSYAAGHAKDSEPQKALDAVERALELRPNSWRALNWAGIVYRNLRRPHEALDYHRRALSINPGSIGVLDSITTLLEEEGDLEGMLDYSRRSVDQTPGVLAGNYFKLERSLIPRGRIEEFVRILEDATQRYGADNPEFLARLCREQRLAGRYRESVATCERALAAREDMQRGQFDLGISQWFAGDSKAALATLRSVRGYYPSAFRIVTILKAEARHEEIEAYLPSLRESASSRISGTEYWSGAAKSYYLSMRRFDDALAVIKETTADDESTRSPEVAGLHLATGSVGEARKILQNCLRECPVGRRYGAHIAMAHLLAAAGDLAAALTHVQRASEVQSDNRNPDETWGLSARLLLASGRESDALDNARKIVGRYWTATPTLYLKAQLVSTLGEADPRAEFELLVKRATRVARGQQAWQDWAQASAIRALGLAHLGEAAQARRAIERAVRMEPERDLIAYDAAAAYAMLGDADNALQWLRTAVDRSNQGLWWARVDPDLDALRDDPRFEAILRDWDVRLRALYE